VSIDMSHSLGSRSLNQRTPPSPRRHILQPVAEPVFGEDEETAPPFISKPLSASPSSSSPYVGSLGSINAGPVTEKTRLLPPHTK
jgi:hypothetical protein